MRNSKHLFYDDAEAGFGIERAALQFAIWDAFEALEKGELANLQPNVILKCPCRCKLTVLWRDGESTHVGVHNEKSELFI